MAQSSFYENTLISGFQAVYLGPFASDPVTDNFGNALATGQLYFNTGVNTLKVYNGSSWQLTIAGSIQNPSGTIGLSAVNGSTGFAMDAGSAPKLSQAIAPTWTGAHLWTGTAPQITLGANGGNAGEIVLEGSSTGSITLTTAASGGELDINGNVVATGTAQLGANGGTGGKLTLEGATSGSINVASDATGATATITAATTAASGAITGASSATLGVNGTAAGLVKLNGSTSGTVTIATGAAAAGTYNFNLPTTAGTSGQVLQSKGGSSAAMVWANVRTLGGTPGSQTVSTSTATITGALVIVTIAAGSTLTLPSAATQGAGAEIICKAGTTLTGTVISASSNVVPLQSVTAGTAIMAIGGKFTHLQSDGTNWHVTALG